MWKFWLIISGLCFVIESFTVGFFVFWFGIGALIALCISLLIDNFFVQSFFFIIASSLLLIFTKPFVKKFIKNTETKPTNVYSVIGKEGIVIQDIDNINGTGQVKIKGEIWSATSDENIEKGTKVKVNSVNGVKVTVEKLLTKV